MGSSYFVIVCNSADNTLGLYDLDGSGQLTHVRDLPLTEVAAAAVVIRWHWIKTGNGFTSPIAGRRQQC